MRMPVPGSRATNGCWLPSVSWCLSVCGGSSAPRNCGSIKRSTSLPHSLRAPIRSRCYTGLLAGKAHPTSGRATIYKAPDGKQYLRLSDFSTSNGPDVHVLLAQSADPSLTQDIVKGQLDSVELGSLKGNQGDQNYDLPRVRRLAEIQRRRDLLRTIPRRFRRSQTRSNSDATNSPRELPAVIRSVQKAAE